SHQNLLPPLAHAAEDMLPRLDAFDEAVATGFGANPDDVARDNDVPQVGAEVFQEPADSAAQFTSVVGLDDTRQAMHAEHAAAKRAPRDVAENAKAGRLGIRFDANDRPLARQLPFAADSLAADQLVFGAFIAGELSRQVFLPATNLMRLAKLRADFPI